MSHQEDTIINATLIYTKYRQEKKNNNNNGWGDIIFNFEFWDTQNSNNGFPRPVEPTT